MKSYLKNFGGPFQGEENFQRCFLVSDVEAYLAALPPAMIWTTQRPTKPGWYWWRYSSHDPKPAVVKVAHGDFGLMLKYGNYAWTPIGEGGEWAGPIAPPIEPPQ